MATLHFIGGKPGAGKTTFARNLGRSLPAVVFCEDDWIVTLGLVGKTLEDFLEADRRCRAVLAALVPDLLRMGVSVVLDYGANTVGRRAWGRSLADASNTDYVVHWLEASDAECLENIHRRNEEQPAGSYYGAVSDERFHTIIPYIVPPAPEEGLNIIRYPGYSRAR